MRTVDRVSLYLGFLLAFTVIRKCESRRHERCLQYGTETLTLSELRTKTHPNGHHSRDGEAKIPGSCFLCKIIVRGLKNYINEQLTLISNALCDTFLAKERKVCQSTTRRYKHKIREKLFKHESKTVCKKFKACR